MEDDDAKWLKDLERESAQLKGLAPGQALGIDMLKEVN